MGQLVTSRDLDERTDVFRDRKHAGAMLAALLERFRGTDAMVLAIPCGGVPVAVEVARRLGLELEVAPVSKVLYPWTTESGFGAVAFDGSALIDAEAVAQHHLTEQQVANATAQAREKVTRRLLLFCSGQGLPVAGRTIIVVDDGVAGGSSVRAALAALRRLGAKQVFVAVPTGHRTSLEELAELADGVFCANARSGLRFAVAEAYAAWGDVSEDDAEQCLHLGAEPAQPAC